MIFSWQPEQTYRLIIAANRDEDYNRPTMAVHQWQDIPDITGGRDLQCQGSWLAVSRHGRFAAVTNFRETPAPEKLQSRGKLVADFLSTSSTATNYLDKVHSQHKHYAGFNLILGDQENIFYYSNRQQEIRMLSPGVYGLSNHLLDTPWPKLKKAKSGLCRLLDVYDNNPPATKLLGIMQDETKPIDSELPDTGVGLAKERFLSSCFIKGQHYGTRNTNILKWSSEGKLIWHEYLFDSHGNEKNVHDLIVTNTV